MRDETVGPDGATAATASGLRTQARKNGRISAGDMLKLPHDVRIAGLALKINEQSHSNVFRIAGTPRSRVEIPAG
ncbi:hypothetical protein BE61_05110 [Bradyrhizobium elkanii USDA 61]|nr:hypothetical protein BE61_05110 [Bradyrhizobium elkanii USDA 61]